MVDISVLPLGPPYSHNPLFNINNYSVVDISVLPLRPPYSHNSLLFIYLYIATISIVGGPSGPNISIFLEDRICFFVKVGAPKRQLTVLFFEKQTKIIL